MSKLTNLYKIAPAISLLLIIFFEHSYKSLISFGNNTPFYDFIILFYFCYFVKGSFSYLSIITLGILKGYLSMMPMTLIIGEFLLLKLLIEKEKQLIKSETFFPIFLLFTVNLALIGAMYILYIESTIEDSNTIAITIIYLRRAAFTIMLYPLFHFIFHQLIKPTPLENA